METEKKKKKKEKEKKTVQSLFLFFSRKSIFCVRLVDCSTSAWLPFLGLLRVCQVSGFAKASRVFGPGFEGLKASRECLGIEGLLRLHGFARALRDSSGIKGLLRLPGFAQASRVCSGFQGWPRLQAFAQASRVCSRESQASGFNARESYEWELLDYPGVSAETLKNPSAEELTWRPCDDDKSRRKALTGQSFHSTLWHR
jgi:hypothetical protein